MGGETVHSASATSLRSSHEGAGWGSAGLGAGKYVLLPARKPADEQGNLPTQICSTFCFTEKLNISERAESNNPNSIIYFKEFFSNLL